MGGYARTSIYCWRPATSQSHSTTRPAIALCAEIFKLSHYRMKIIFELGRQRVYHLVVVSISTLYRNINRGRAMKKLWIFGFTAVLCLFSTMSLAGFTGAGFQSVQYVLSIDPPIPANTELIADAGDADLIGVDKTKYLVSDLSTTCQTKSHAHGAAYLASVNKGDFDRFRLQYEVGWRDLNIGA